MRSQLRDLFDAHGDVVDRDLLLRAATLGELRGLHRRREVHRLWHGVYSSRPPTVFTRVRGLELGLRSPVTVCAGSAAGLFGFDTENVVPLHIVDPGERHIRSRSGLVVHQRTGAPTVTVNDLQCTDASWTAMEVARELSRPRALATYDRALSTGAVSVASLAAAANAQKSRAGIVHARALIPLAHGAAGSPMESELRLLVLDSGLAPPVLQFPVHDEAGLVRFYLDLAWPDAKVALEYDGDDFHSSPLDVRRDKMRTGWLLDRGWLVLAVVADDVRRHPERLVRRVASQLAQRSPVTR